jgi:DNA-directed RNA polymerase subunit RPC12/RpoP
VDRKVWLLRKFIDELRATTSKARKTFSELDYTTGSSDYSNVSGDGNRDTKIGKNNKQQRESKRNDSSGKSPKKARPDRQHDANKDTPTNNLRCTHCNSKIHAKDKCKFVHHPDYILKGAWRDSDVGLAYKTLDPKAPLTH